MRERYMAKKRSFAYEEQRSNSDAYRGRGTGKTKIGETVVKKRLTAPTEVQRLVRESSCSRATGHSDLSRSRKGGGG
jgi:hypothetical protein